MEWQHLLSLNIQIKVILIQLISEKSISKFVALYHQFMDSKLHQPHFVLLPLMSSSHLIPMIDMAKLLAQHGVIVTIVTTPQNAIRFNSITNLELQIQLLTIPFPSIEFGLPKGCENFDKIPSRDLIKNFFAASNMLQQPFENLLQNLKPNISCIISGKNLGWTVETCKRFRIPRIFFDGMGCFSLTCNNKLETFKVHQSVSNDSEAFVIPDLPHRIELTKAKLPENLNPAGSSTELTEVINNLRAKELEADGIVVNSFEELEGDYVNEYKKVKGNTTVWCVGPVSVCNKKNLERGGMASIDVDKLMKWLDSWESGSVIYACLGSICGLKHWQLKDLGLGLEASNRPFIWVIRKGESLEELKKWVLEEGFENRIKGRGFLIWGWSPQVLVLSHPSIGAFLTHCGWNSVMEGTSAGVPIITCPLFAEQFLNEKLIVDVLGIGVSVGVEAAVTWGLEENSGLVMKKENVKKAIEMVMDKGEEAEKRRKKATEIGEMAKRTTEKGGSSYINMEMLIQFVKQQYLRKV